MKEFPGRYVAKLAAADAPTGGSFGLRLNRNSAKTRRGTGPQFAFD